MSEVKFACPVCGQHITCDSAKSGTHMPCPTCYRELVVPQAPAGNGSKLILTAAEVQARPTVTAPTGLLDASTPTRRSTVPAVLLVLFLITVGAAAYVFRDTLFRRAASESAHSEESPATTQTLASAPVNLKLAPSDADQNWTLDPASVQLTDLPASGRVHGFSFALDRATITGGTLQLRQGPKWPPDLGVTINLFAERGEDLAGKTINIEATRAESPRVTLRWKNEQGSPMTETVRGKYALRLEFGAVTNKSLPGRLFLATQDAGKSFVNGSFTAEIRKPSPPKK